ncbi:MAG: LUD domain-containing protein [Candidatus Hydrogenedentes bacterium]|nr:LUD domain-containing protein [Candidatus Hydrogenedentota bacterium]
MADVHQAALKARIVKALEEPKHSAALLRCMQRGRDNRARALTELPGGADFRGTVKAVKDRCIEHQVELVNRFIANAEARGTRVFCARNGQEAIDYVLKLASDRKAKVIAKSKSLTTEEIEINDPLIEAGLKVIETDLGELIIQLVHEKPYHLVFPSVHKMAADVAKIFAKETGTEVSEDIPSIMKVVRAYLRPIFLNADIGMTGANVGIAENGCIVIETNEGNGRLVSSIGDCHVCVMGIEKIVDTIEDAMLMVLAHPVSASGQLPTTYVTWMGGRSPLGEGESRGPRESHIILLDNGRRSTRDDVAMRESLNCIRCGACMNVCPTYGVVGGHVFGHIYPGPIGIPWTAQVHGLENAGAFASLCISCGLCKEICPAEIDMPMMIAEVKRRFAVEHGFAKAERTMMGADGFAALGSAMAPIANRMIQSKTARKVMRATLGIDERRALPPFTHQTFKKWFHARKRVSQESKRRVAFFVDVFANHNRPDLGQSAVELLERLGCEVALPEQRSSGYPFIAYGNLDKAREVATFNIARLAPFAKDGYDIVATEPTAAYCLKSAYLTLLHSSNDSEFVAGRSHEFFEYLIDFDTGTTEFPSLKGRRFGFHISCHQRPLGAGHGAVEWIRRHGGEVKIIETGTCCGMGGTFGLKSGPLGYDLSMAVGKPLFDLFNQSGVDAILTESSVCAIQLREGTGLPVYHPLELLAQ